MNKEKTQSNKIKIPNENCILNLKEEKDVIDLSDQKQKEDKDIYRIIELGNGIRIRIISSDQGVYIDIRKYHIDHYTHRGVRIPVTKFIRASELVKNDYETMKNL
jgi:hypothetical protein